MSGRNALRRVVALVTVLALPLLALPAATADEPTGVTLAITEVDLNGPAISPVTVTVENGGNRSLSRLRVTFSGPTGWTVYPDSRSVKARVAPGETVDVEFDIRVPQQRPGIRFRTFRADATYRGGDQAGSATATRTQRTGDPLPDLAAAYNNVGVSNEDDPTKGDFDGDGNSFSAQLLEGQGVTPGSSVQAVGAQFTWPEAAAGTPNNVAAAGQTISLSGQGQKLAFLGSGASLAATGGATVYYTDGTTSTGNFGFPNWSFQAADEHGATLVISMNGRNTPSGLANTEYQYRVFANTIDLDPTKTVEMVTLPSSGSLHIFDMAIVD